MANEEPNISYALSIMEEGAGAIRVVPLGLAGDLSAIIITFEEDPNDDEGIIVNIQTGEPFKQDLVSVAELADIFSSIGNVLSGEGFTDAWKAELAAREVKS